MIRVNVSNEEALALFRGFWKGLSNTLDYLPLVGGVKNTIEAFVGYSMTGEKMTTGERLLLGGLGVASAIIDVFTFGFGTGLVQGGKAVGKQVAKGMMKQVGKYAVMDITTSVALGWTSNYASEKLTDMGLSSEEIFMVHLVASLSVMGYSKYKTNKVNINASDKETVEIITDGSHLENGKLNPLGKTEGLTKAELNTCDSIKKIINDRGYPVDEFAQLLHPDRILSDSEKLLVDSVRKEIGLPSSDTLMCKTIPQSDIYKYLYNSDYDGVRGFTAVEEHGANLKTLLDKYNGARLDYNNTAFKTTNGVDGISQSAGLPDKFYGTIEYKVNNVDKISIPD